MSKNEEVMDAFDVDEGLYDRGQRPKRRQKTKKKMLLKKSADDKVVVKVNRFGVHAGKEWTELANYIGVLVRDHVSIVHDEWRHVAVKLKDEMWNHLKELFVLSENSKKHVLATMSVAFRNFKSELRTDFIYQHEHELEKLALPPEEYKHISDKEWKLFVKKTFSEEFVEKSNKAKERRKKHKLNHRLGSTGYGGLLLKKQEELGVNLEDIDRCDTWLLGRKRKDGTYDDDVKEVANEIEDLKRKVQEGSFVPSGDADVLSTALQKKPNGSRVQGLGHFITPTQYFHKPKETRTDREKEHEMCEQRYKMMVMKFEEMRTQVSHAISEIGSSSIPNKSPIVKAAGEVDQPKLTPVKRRRVTVPRSSPPDSSKNKEPKSNESEEEGDTKGKRKATEVPKEQKLTPQKKHLAAVSRRSPRFMQMKNLPEESVVRAANNTCISEASREQVVVELGGTKTKVEPPHLKEESIPKMIEVEAGGVVVVKEHGRTKMKSKQPPARKLIMQRTTRFAAEKRKEKSNSMKMFSMLVDKCLGDGYLVEHDAEIFGFATKSIFNKQVCDLVISFEQVNNSVVEIWCRHLYEKMLEDGGNMPVQFGTSAAVPVPLKPSDESITRRSRYIADLLGVGLPGQITLIPYNTCNHWVLVAIDVVAWTVYYLDSIGENPSEDLSPIVNQGVKIHHASVSKKRLSLNWVTVMCPKQTGSMECGYFLMKYMSDIVCDVNVLKKNFSTIKDYSEQDILQVCEEWAAYATKLVLKCG